jgi:hypothetical protein
MTFPLNSAGQYMAAHDANSSENSDVPSLVTAGGTGDGTKNTGKTIDRKSGTALAHSMVLVTGWLASLTDTKSISFTIELQESANDSSWDSAEVVQALTVEKLATATTEYRGVNEQSIDLMTRKRYIRFNVTCTMSNTTTDIATFHSIGVLGGWNQIPQ